MKYDCPHCDANLRMKLVKNVAAEGERKFLPSIGKTVCPVCKSTITANPHWSEVIVSVLIAIPLLLFFQLELVLRYKKEAIVGVVIWLVIVTSLMMWAHFRYLRCWQRYRAP